MQEIKLAMEIPTAHLEDFSPMLSFDFCLAHLIHESVTYREFYREQVAKGRVVLLDNSTFELGEPLTVKEIIEAGQRISYEHLRPTLIAPDFPGNRIKTTHHSFELLREGLRSGWQIGAVAQGHDVSDIAGCYWELVEAPFDPLCFTFMSPMYHVLSCIPMVYNKWHHLFSYYDLEHIRWIRSFIPFPRLLSMDTSKPIKAAINGTNLRNHKRGEGRLDHKAKLEREQRGQAHANIVELKQMCSGFIEPHAGVNKTPSLEDEYWKGSFHASEGLRGATP